ncbi:hypothetical protein BU204_04920 [Actinophytocola xanthii]|uniref:Uncharacterized protein n=2 Tax=Actinophytocola xanthii TaxID=1912961 RepID=A0A1Q8CWF6_9PSEU|nr:hypothetical protein BU204_04920 [Actinophytocola xanthii]
MAGLFAEAFGVDVTTATVTCASCGAAGRFADSHVYDRAPGAVARCAGCQAVLARLVRTPTEVWLDLRGARSVRVPLTPSA